MQTTLITTKRTLAGAVGAAMVLLAGPTQAALQDRDLNGDTVVDAFYDTDLNITWLRDADVNGFMTWTDAVAWAGAYSIGGYSGWRLPTCPNCDRSPPDAGEMGHLWQVELGNPPGGPLANTGGFQNMGLRSPYYWTGTDWGPNYAWVFGMSDGSVGLAWKTDTVSKVAMAVHDGDIGLPPVPEPASFALMLAGLATLALVSRRRSG